MVFALAILTLSTGCRAVFRYPAETQATERSREEILLDGMNPYVLTNLVSSKVVLEVDWVEGVAPHPAALKGLKKTLAHYLPEGKQIEIELDDEIPAAEWDSISGEPSEKAEILARWLDHDPRDWENYEFVYLVYVPDPGDYVGLATQLYLDSDAGLRVVPTLFIHLNSIARESFLWITTRKVEQAILVHEMGHILGLVSGLDHVEKDNPRHCTEPQCVMAHFRTRSQIYNALPAMFAGKIPDDYGNKCRDDIGLIQEIWAEQAGSDPGFVERLRSRREVEVLRMQACWYSAHDRWPEAVSSLGQARKIALAAGLEVETMEGDDDVLVFKRCPEM